MKVLKFGGSSVGTAESIQFVKNIVERAGSPTIVVVSALGGVTDQLLALTRLAAKGDETYVAQLNELVARHHDLINQVIDADKRPQLLQRVNALLDELRSILHGVCLIQDLTPKTSDAIVAYGERISSEIVAQLITGATHYDSRKFIKTEHKADKHWWTLMPRTS